MATMAMQRGAGGGYVQRSGSSGLADVLDVLLDKGLVVDVFLRVSLVGIELLTVDARIVIASVDTYLRFAEAVNRLDLQESQPQGLPEVIGDLQEGGAKDKTKGVLEGAKEKLLGSSDDDGDDDEKDDKKSSSSGRSRSSSRSRRSASSSGSSSGSRGRSSGSSRGRSSSSSS